MSLSYMARPTGLTRIASRRSSPLRGALRASKTLARFVERSSDELQALVMASEKGTLSFSLKSRMSPLSYRNQPQNDQANRDQL
jgi:hypothetical protein